MSVDAKSWVFVLMSAVSLAACSREGAPNPDKDPHLAMNTLLVANACSNCHASDYPRVGPSMKDVAASLGESSPENIARIKDSMVKGVKGKWGEAVMPVQKQVTPEAADEIATAIQALAPKPQ